MADEPDLEARLWALENYVAYVASRTIGAPTLDLIGAKIAQHAPTPAHGQAAINIGKLARRKQEDRGW